MARIGMRYPKYCKITITENQDGTESESYGALKTLGKAISASTTVNFTSSDLYADDGKAESVRQFTGGSLTINTDEIENTELADISGATTDEGGGLTFGTDDTAPYLRLGWLRKRMKRGATAFGGLVLTRVKFAPIGDEDNSAGESITFGTPTMTADIFKNHEGKWRKYSQWFDTETAAVAWLDANVKPTPSGT